MTGVRGAVAAAVLMAGMVGCDQSKAELDQTKTQLQTVTAERDTLKNQVVTLQSQLTALTQQLSDANGKLAAASASQHAGLPGATTGQRSRVNSPSEQTTTQRQAEQKAAEQQMTGPDSMKN